MNAAAAARDLDIKALPLGHLPLVMAVLDDLSITAVLDELLPKDPRSNVSDADCVAIMVLNILGGRTALYRMENWTQKLPVDVLIGPHASPSDFSDARLARTLDHLHKVGTDNVLSTTVAGFLRREDRPQTYSLHQDSTSASVYGAYAGEPPAWAPRMLHGFSKDHRPDLKQLVFGLTLQGCTGLPLVATMFDGNTSDKFFNAFHIESLAGLLPDEDDVTLVADSKLVDGQLLGALLDQEMHFISLVPRTYAVRDEALKRLAAEDDEHPELGRTPRRSAKEADSVYRGRSYDLPFRVRRSGATEDETVTFRFLAIHSDALAKKFEAGLPERLVKDEAALKKAFNRANRKPYSCEKDAEAALGRLRKTRGLHTWSARVERFETPGKRPRGRPRKGAPVPPPQVHYRLVLEGCAVDEAAVATLRRTRSHLVLVTDHLNRETHSDAHILNEYRHQHLIEGHTGFRWLKGPAQIAPLFLKSAARISGLGLVLVLALMVRNYVQWVVRKSLAEKEETLPYYDRKRATNRPTTEVVWELFSELVLLVLSGPDFPKPVLRLQGFTDAQRRVLEMLGVGPARLTARKKPGGGAWPTVGM